MKTFFLCTLLALSAWCYAEERSTINLSGKWAITLDSMDTKYQYPSKNTTQVITLPGTTDQAGLGIADTLSPLLQKPQLTHLTRKYSYIGPALYSKNIEIPKSWKNKRIRLKLERTIWKSRVWIDGKDSGLSGESLTTPHYFDLSTLLTPGPHQITICIDNRKQQEISTNNLAHAYTNDTQIMWNGILGDIQLEAFDPIYISDLRITTDITKKGVTADITIENHTKSIKKGILKLQASSKNGEEAPVIDQSIEIRPGSQVISLHYLLGKNAKMWDEFNPHLYTLTASFESGKNKSTQSESFGLRKISRDGSVLTINDQPLFLRGTLECCIFPLTGCPPTTKEGWFKVFNTAKLWGLNHLRFHSWCPPKAAFEVADEMGFYLQVELPVWELNIGTHQRVTDFLSAEADRIIKEYGNHPSFCLWSMGNELQGDFKTLTKLMTDLQKKDPRHLYTTTSFTFEKGHGDWPEPLDDFFITQWTPKGWVRGQGVFNSEVPSFDKDYSSSVDSMTVPLITHEIGQYAVYPNLEEIDKYTGVLKPNNFLAVQADLVKKEMLDKAALYTQASGKLATILYKEEIERAMKTAGISGFQLLDLHDFPGQGTALVGLLDAFWDSKGVCTADEFRGFCSSIVPLLRFPKAIYLNKEKFEAVLELSNYSGNIIPNASFSWTLSNIKGLVMASGKVVPQKTLKQGYNHEVGNISTLLNKVSNAEKLTLTVKLDNTTFQNSWNIWVYPAQEEIQFGKVKYTQDYNQAIQWLAQGEKVLLNPDWHNIAGIEGKFVPVFWSPVHFPKQAGSMGLLCDPTHQALAHFPTDMHTDWQWWDLNINSTTLVIDSLQGGTPIVEMIDNFTNNRKLTSLIEGRVENGTLMIASFDLSTDLDKRPVAKQMLYSLLQYMNSESFSPAPIKNIEILKDILNRPDKQSEKEKATSIY